MVNTQKMVSFLYIFGAFGGGSELAGITRRHLMLEDPTKPPSAGLTPCWTAPVFNQRPINAADAIPTCETGWQKGCTHESPV
jgi:hypothetical protein